MFIYITFEFPRVGAVEKNRDRGENSDGKYNIFLVLIIILNVRDIYTEGGNK